MSGLYLSEELTREFGASVIDGVSLSEGWYREHTAPMKADLEDDLFDLVKDADTQDDLAAFRMVRGVPRIPDLRVAAGDTGAKRHGDAGISILLAHAASRAEFYEIEHMTTDKPRIQTRMGDYFGSMGGSMGERM